MGRIWIRALWLGVVGLLALTTAQLIVEDRRYALVVVFVAAAWLGPRWFARRRMREVLLSGDVALVLRSWQPSLDRTAHAATMAPVMTATAYAAYGFVEPARRALGRAAKGPAWEAAFEQRLIVEALLDVYDGERSRAVERGDELERLALPPTGYRMRRKISRLRGGVAAMTRAFAHASRGGDERSLLLAGRASPLIFWAMRYARAVLLIDAGRMAEARSVLEHAPSWPEESVFRAFHDELVRTLEPALVAGGAAAGVHET